MLVLTEVNYAARVVGRQLTPQKKWRMNITKTLLATFGPEYKLLKGLVLPSLSKTIILSTFFSTSWEGISLLVLTSPTKSMEGSTPSNEVSIEVFGGVALGGSMIIA